MREMITIRAQEPIYKRVESITPRGGSIGYTAEYVVNAAFNLADGVITLDEFMAAVKMGPSDKRAPKVVKPKPVRARKPPIQRKAVDPSQNPWDV